ncbi:MAG TPA: hypothetical protein VLB82_10670 [Thermodesulfobacteriota bacterium]|nr:hypothetical protein [Thermodesulfobacteriota bacterium]
MPLYTVTFTDGTTFEGGKDIYNSKWLDIPDKPIKCLEYSLGDDSTIKMYNKESYLCFVEAKKTAITKVGDCPKCGSKAKISKGNFTTGEGKQIPRYVGRCTNEKCAWIGQVTNLKYCESCGPDGAQFIYFMGLKNGKVKSHRITLEGNKEDSKYITGDVTTRYYDLGKEHRGRPTNLKLWKRGIK